MNPYLNYTLDQLTYTSDVEAQLAFCLVEFVATITVSLDGAFVFHLEPGVQIESAWTMWEFQPKSVALTAGEDGTLTIPGHETITGRLLLVLRLPSYENGTHQILTGKVTYYWGDLFVETEPAVLSSHFADTPTIGIREDIIAIVERLPLTTAPTCPVCNNPVSEQEQTCPACGAALKADVLPDPPDEFGIICPNCAHNNPSELYFCAQCGAPLPKTMIAPLPPSPPADEEDRFSSVWLDKSSHDRRITARLWDWWRRVVTSQESMTLDEDLSITTIPLPPLDPYQLPLSANFRFIHEPYHQAAQFDFIGRETEVENLAHHILFTNGGAVLVTGYRGVGKTSFVNRAVERAREILPEVKTQLGYQDLLYIQFNLAREMAPNEIMHHIIRRTHQALVERDLIGELSHDTRLLVETAYRRTAYSISQKRGDMRSGQAGVSLPEVPGWGSSGGISFGRGWSRSNEEQAMYLGYDDKASEFDVIQLLHHLAYGQQKGRRRRRPLKVVISFDELDKISTYVREDGQLAPNPYIDQVVAALKTVLTTSGVVFIFIAGRDFYQRWQADLRHTDSVYDSVFAHQIYIPCEWDFPQQLLNVMYDPQDASPPDRLVIEEALVGFLRFNSRGITRRAYRSVNQMVRWQDKRPYLVMNEKQLKRIRFYEELDRLLTRHMPQILSPIRERVNLHLYEDEYRSYTYRLAETIIETAGRDFTGTDLLRIGQEEIPLLSEYELANLTNIILSILVDNHYVQRIDSHFSGFAEPLYRTPKPNVPSAQQRFRLADSVLIKLNEVNLQEEQESKLLGVQGHYDLLKKIGEGGFTEVYLAYDRQSGKRVALKQAKDFYWGDLPPAETLRQEGHVLAKLLNDPQLHVIGLHQDRSLNEPAFLAIEYVDGVNLKEALQLVQSFTVDEVLALLAALAQPIIALHEREIFQLDIKPANFMLTESGQVFLIDLGSAVDMSIAGQQRGTIQVGTPEYAAPELRTGEIQSLELADIYSFGIMMFELLVGQLPSDRALRWLRARDIQVETESTVPSGNDAANVSPQLNWGRWRRLMLNYFNVGELQTLCFDLAIDYESLPGVGKWDKTRELLDYASRHQQVEAMLSYVQGVRPHVDWTVVYDLPETPSPTVPPAEPAVERLFGGTVIVKNLQDDAGSILDALGRAVALAPSQRFSSLQELMHALPPARGSIQSVVRKVFNLNQDYEQAVSYATVFDLADLRPPQNTNWSPPTASENAQEAAVVATPSPPNSAEAANFTARLHTGFVGQGGTYDLVDLQDGTRYRLQGEKVRIGRLPNNEIVLDHQSVSRLHTLIENRPPNQWIIVNLQSSNGTWVNGRRLDNAIPLEPGDVIRIGKFEFQVEPGRATTFTTSPTPTPLPIQKVLTPQTLLNGRYLITEVLGRGGMSCVYLATDQETNQPVAVKQMLFPSYATEDHLFEEMRDLFVNEIQVLERLDHPNIVRLYNDFFDGQDYFFTMEYIQGPTARQLVEQTQGRGLPEAQVIDWARQICEVLTYLHEQTPPIIYRDIKPDNIIITPTGEVKLLDFGAARHFKRHRREDTQKLGTPGYASPEQFSGAQTDPTTDIYSLGITLQYLLTGRAPTDRSPANGLNLQAINPQISAKVSEAIAKATRVERQERFSSAAAFWAALKPKPRPCGADVQTPYLTGIWSGGAFCLVGW